MKKRKAYVKQINKNLYHVCLEYGQAASVYDMKIRKDLVLEQIKNLDDAIEFKNKHNEKKKS